MVARNVALPKQFNTTVGRCKTCMRGFRYSPEKADKATDAFKTCAWRPTNKPSSFAASAWATAPPSPSRLTQKSAGEASRKWSIFDGSVDAESHDFQLSQHRTLITTDCSLDVHGVRSCMAKLPSCGHGQPQHSSSFTEATQLGRSPCSLSEWKSVSPICKPCWSHICHHTQHHLSTHMMVLHDATVTIINQPEARWGTDTAARCIPGALPTAPSLA